MSVNIEDALLHSIAQEGESYVFGTEVSGTTSDRWDCSELVEVACRAAGIRPTVPDGAYYQWKHSTPVTVQTGIDTRGALLFVGDGTGVGRDAITHVAWSLGDGTTIEARGSAWGVGVWPAAERFDFAGLIPGAAYGLPAPFPVPPPEVGMRVAPCSHWRDPDDSKVYRVAADGLSRTHIGTAELEVDEALLALAGFTAKVHVATKPTSKSPFDFYRWLKGIPLAS